MPGNFHVVLIEPEIPQNTGTIGRACLAVGATLHLVKPLGFSIDSTQVKRSGLDYWEHLSLQVHESLEDFDRVMPSTAEKFLIETRAGRTIYDSKIPDGSYLIFGKETTGIPEWFLNKHSADMVRIPMWDARVRSLNLSNAVSIVLYEGIRQNLCS